ncbi:MAG TPA: hypothetical protein VI874_02920 [Candidatus Norongarragalinales archaeon]|nr:hypothetical protein [Candidatus Norongarragalinales archaeon]
MEEIKETHGSEEFLKFQQDMKNPLVVGALISSLKDERTSTNLILKEINAKLDRLAGLLENTKTVAQAPLLPEVDDKILTFLKTKGKTNSEEVQMHFQYKGKNAASARLNGLYRLGLVEKRQVGKKVFFLSK